MWARPRVVSTGAPRELPYTQGPASCSQHLGTAPADLGEESGHTIIPHRLFLGQYLLSGKRLEIESTTEVSGFGTCWGTLPSTQTPTARRLPQVRPREPVGWSSPSGQGWTSPPLPLPSLEPCHPPSGPPRHSFSGISGIESRAATSRLVRLQAGTGQAFQTELLVDTCSWWLKIKRIC